MPDIAASNVTVTVLRRRVDSNRRVSDVTIAFGDGALTYPTGGVPMPAATAFGMTGVLEKLIVYDDDDAQGILYKVDGATNKVRIWFPTQQTAGTGNRAGIEYTGGATAVPATTLYAEATGW